MEGYASSEINRPRVCLCLQQLGKALAIASLIRFPGELLSFLVKIIASEQMVSVIGLPPLFLSCSSSQGLVMPGKHVAPTLMAQHCPVKTPGYTPETNRFVGIGRWTFSSISSRPTSEITLDQVLSNGAEAPLFLLGAR